MSKSWSVAFIPERHVAVASLGLNDKNWVRPERFISLNSAKAFAADTPFKRDAPTLDRTQLNARLKEKLGPRFEIPGHFREQAGQFSTRAFSVDGAAFYAQSPERQPTVVATSVIDKVVLTDKEVPDHGAFPSARLKPGERLTDKNTIFDLPTLRPFPFLKVKRAQDLVESFISAAQTSPHIAAQLQELGQGSTKIILATSGRPYQAKTLGDSDSATVYVNGPVDIAPTFVPSRTGIGGHFTVMPKVEEGITLYMPHSETGYSVASIEQAVKLLRQALSGQRLNPKAAVSGLENAPTAAPVLNPPAALNTRNN